MSWLRHRAYALVAAVLTPGLLVAGPNIVGVASSDSLFTAGRSNVRGQATLFEGDAVRSHFLATRLRLSDGSRYVLGIGSEGVVKRGYLQLRSGSVEIGTGGRSSRVVAGQFQIAADTAGSSASVYLSDSGLVTVMVRSGEVKVGRLGAASTQLLRAGQAVSLRTGKGGALQLDSKDVLAEVTRVQADQIAGLSEAAARATCLEPKAAALSRSFATLSSQLAANVAARSVIQTRIDRGMATPTDYQRLGNLDGQLRALESASATLGFELNDVAQDHHPGPPPASASPHRTHEHLHDVHHGEHGHSVNPSGGHHADPPHSAAGPAPNGSPE